MDLQFPNMILPGTCDNGRFIWYHANKTAFYIGKTCNFINIASFKPNSEIAGLNLSFVSDIKKAIATNNCTLAIFEQIGWWFQTHKFFYIYIYILYYI